MFFKATLAVQIKEKLELVSLPFQSLFQRQTECMKFLWLCPLSSVFNIAFIQFEKHKNHTTVVNKNKLGEMLNIDD